MSARDVPPVCASMDRLSACLVRYAARRSPASLSERLEEEWLSHLSVQSGPVSRLRFALGCFRALAIISFDHGTSGVAAGSSIGGRASATALLPPEGVSRRTALFILILALHALAIYAFASGLGRAVVTAIPARMKIGLIETTRRREPLSPPSRADISSWNVRPTIVVPPLNFPVITAASVPREDGGTTAQLPPSTTSVPQAAVRILGGPGMGFPNTGDFYPEASRRTGETGSATVRVCVDAHGRLTGEPVIEASSGSSRLDRGALELARAGSGHYRSTTEDGIAVTSCYPFRIRFEMRN